MRIARKALNERIRIREDKKLRNTGLAGNETYIAGGSDDQPRVAKLCRDFKYSSVVYDPDRVLVNFSYKVYEPKDEHMDAYLAEVCRMEK